MEKELQRAMGRIEGKIEDILARLDRGGEWQIRHEQEDNNRHESMTDQVAKIKTIQDVQIGKYSIIASVSGAIGAVVSAIIVWWITKRM